MGQAEDLTGDGGVLKTVLTPGSGDLPPDRGARIYIHYTLRTQSDQLLDSRDFSFRLGHNLVIPGLEKICSSMKLHEKCSAIVSPQYAFRQKGYKGQAKGESVKLEVELVKVEGGAKDIRMMGARERFELAVEWKEKGNVFFKDSKYQKAKTEYEKCLSCLQYLFYKTDEQIEEEGKVGEGKMNGENGNMGEVKQNGDVKEDETKEDDAKQDETKEGENERDEEGEKAEQRKSEEEKIQENDAKAENNDENNTTTRKENGDATENDNSKEAASQEDSNEDKEKTETKSSTQSAQNNSEADDPSDEEIRQMRMKVLNNLALTVFKLGNNNEAVQRASVAVQISKPEDENYKALYYRGRALIQLGSWDKAKEDLVAAKEIAPNNAGIKCELIKLQKKVQAHKEREKKAAAAMFA